MFFEEILLYLAESAWALILHLSSGGSFPKPLKPDEEAELVNRMFAGDDAARDRLIEHNLRLVAHIAKKYSHSTDDTDDLISIGSIGLIKAVHTFKPEAGKLTTYASRCIENEIRMHLRAVKKLRTTSTMSDSVSRDREGNEVQQEDMENKKSEMKQILWNWGKAMERFRWKEEELERLQEVHELQKKVAGEGEYSKAEWEEVEKEYLSQRRRLRIEMVEILRQQAWTDKMIRRLNMDEQAFVQMRFEKGYGFEYIGLKMHLSRATVFRMQNKVLEKMCLLQEEDEAA